MNRAPVPFDRAAEGLAPMVNPPAGLPMEVDLLIQAEDGARQTRRVRAGGPISIGRHPRCTVCLESDLVSRQHVVVSINGASLLVEDTSTNGTLAGGTLLHRSALEVSFGTPLTIGNFTVMVHPVVEHGPRSGGSSPPRATPAPQSGARGPGPSGLPPMPSTPFPAPTHEVRMSAPAPAPMTTGPLPAAGPALPTMSGPIPLTTGPAVSGAHRGVAMTAAVPAAHNDFGQTAPRPSTEARGVDPSAEPDRARDLTDADVALRREIHKQLLEHLDLATLDPSRFDDPSLRPKVLTALRRLVRQYEARIPPHIDRDTLVGELVDEALGLGPLERFLADPAVSEVMVVDPRTIYVERAGKLTLSNARFTDDERVRAVIERIVTPLGRRIDESSPLVDARLKDGSRVNAVIRPIALRGSCITIRKFSRVPLDVSRLIELGAITESMARFLTRSVIAHKNIVISGGTGSGKTTLLNVLSAAIPETERVVTIEDAAELQLKQPHVVSLETRPANMEGKGEYSIRDLVKNALRMRPDRIVVGECRGGEALDMLQAMNTGHDGSLTTTHANSPGEAVTRLETLCLMAGVDLPARAIREQIASSIHLVVQQSRMSDGTRKVTAIHEVIGIEGETGEIQLRPIFEFVRTGTDSAGKVAGQFRATGFLPTFLNDFIVLGLVKRGERYLLSIVTPAS